MTELDMPMVALAALLAMGIVFTVLGIVLKRSVPEMVQKEMNKGAK